MSSSHKSRNMKKKARNRHERIRAKKQHALIREIVSKTKNEAFKTSIHEVGHAIVRKKFLRNTEMTLTIKPGNNGNFTGITENLDTKDPDSPEIMSRVSVAGVIAETIGSKTQKKQSFELLFRLKDDRDKFLLAKRDLRDIESKAIEGSPEEYFGHVFDEVIKILKTYSLLKIKNLSQKLSEKRILKI